MEGPGGVGFGGSGWGVRMDVNEELKYLGGSGGVGLGVRVDVSEELKFK